MENEKENCQKGNKMTLKDYYNALPPKTCPKTDFVKTVATQCDVSQATVRWWLRGTMRPSRKEFYRVLSDVTGIPQENLFD
jgi:hypothetical protein